MDIAATKVTIGISLPIYRWANAIIHTAHTEYGKAANLMRRTPYPRMVVIDDWLSNELVMRLSQERYCNELVIRLAQRHHW